MVEVIEIEAQTIKQSKKLQSPISSIRKDEGDKRTALTFAVSEGYFEIAKALTYNHKADIRQKDGYSESAIDCARKFAKYDVGSGQWMLYNMLCNSDAAIGCSSYSKLSVE